jgi:hypothetical protein
LGKTGKIGRIALRCAVEKDGVKMWIFSQEFNSGRFWTLLRTFTLRKSKQSFNLQNNEKYATDPVQLNVRFLQLTYSDVLFMTVSRRYFLLRFLERWRPPSEFQFRSNEIAKSSADVHVVFLCDLLKYKCWCTVSW